MADKTCLICQKEFVANSNVQKFCSPECFKIYRKNYKNQYRLEHPEEVKKYNKTHRQNLTPEQIENKKVLSHIYYENNKEKHLEQSKKYREEHKEQFEKYGKEYYRTHKEQNKINCQEYSKNHRKELNEYMREWKKNHPDSLFIDKIRHRISQALKFNYKSAHTMELIGCSIEFLKSHLESQFTKGMTWKNYGKWHVDHIRPCASFDLSTPENQKLCFNYKNMQPLWAKENLEKGAKYNG